MAALLVLVGIQPVMSHAGAQAVAGADQKALHVATGDILVQHDSTGWHSVRILAVDRTGDGSKVAHCLFYNDAHDKPSVDSVRGLGVRNAHIAMLADSFEKGWERIGNQPPTNQELAGYVESLKYTDFPAYVKFTHQDPEKIAADANVHYGKAVALDDSGKTDEAIAEYGKAIEIFPLFFEALDNRGFAYMGMGKYAQALTDFNSSLFVNPDGDDALLAKGECLLKLGKTADAIAVFNEGVKRFPQQRAKFQKDLDQARATKPRGSS